MNEQETILIVDDDENTRKSLSLIFNKKGYETETAGTGQEAIDRAQERFLNLALLDVRLPDLEGVALLATLKAMHPDMVIIMATAYASLETAVQALNKGASAYITKPLNMDEVLATVREAPEKQCLVLENRRLYREIQRELAERRRAEEEIRQRTAQLEALRQVGLNLTAQLDLDILLHAIAAQAIELLQGKSGGLYLHQREREVLEWVTAVGHSPISLGSTLRRGEGLSGTVWETGKPLVVNNYQHWEERAPIYRDIPNLAVAGAPVRWGEQSLGVLTVEDAPPRTFSLADAELLSLFATHAAIAIRNARLYEQANRRLAEARLVQEVMLATASTLDFNFALERTLKALLMFLIRLDTGQIEEEFEMMCGVHASLSAVLNTTLRQVEEQATAQGVTLENEIDPRLPPVRLCETFFVDAFSRLVDNAIKFSRHEPKRVTVSTQVTGDWVEIAVTDRGVGIPAEHLSHVFERFRQIGREQMKQQGIGVGLSIAQELIRLHGGEITVESVLDEGSTFTIRLPVAEQPE